MLSAQALHSMKGSYMRSFGFLAVLPVFSQYATWRSLPFSKTLFILIAPPHLLIRTLAPSRCAFFDTFPAISLSSGIGEYPIDDTHRTGHCQTISLISFFRGSGNTPSPRSRRRDAAIRTSGAVPYARGPWLSSPRPRPSSPSPSPRPQPWRGTGSSR